MKIKVFGLAILLAFLATAHVQAINVIVEPDDFAQGTNISNAVSGVTLSAFSTPPLILSTVPTPAVLADVNLVGNYAPTGRLVFATTNVGAGNFRTSWYRGDNLFRADFTSPTDFVSIMTGPDANTDVDPARFEIYNSSNVLLDAIDFPGNVVATASFSRVSPDIAYLIATNPIGVSGESFILDHLVFNSVGGGKIPEPTTMLLLGSGLLGLAGYGRKKLFKK